MTHHSTKNPFNIIVIVAALGYFVDIYDLILFSIVRVPSLQSMGLSGQSLTDTGILLLNVQMMGMLLGGILWGILGDKKGRLSVLFMTILLYSLANIANGMVQTLPQYLICRFLAGLGLAGELGIGITLVSEVMTKESRGYGTTVVSGIGIIGAVAGFLVADMFDWRMAYYVGGGLGLALLFLRVTVYESGMFKKLHESKVRKGNFFSLFTNKTKLKKYIFSILIGVPVWYVIGILITLSPEFASAGSLHVSGAVVGGKAVMYHYVGASIGAFLTGIISQKLKSRKKALFISLVWLTFTLVLYFTAFGVSSAYFYFIAFMIGLPQGYWAVFVTTASEQFGTNMRATVTTTVPNFVRGTTVLMNMLFVFLKPDGRLGTWSAGLTVGIIVMGLAFYALYRLEETYHKDLDYIEVS